MLLVICHLSCDVIGYEGSEGDWCFLIYLLSQLDCRWLLVKLSFVQSFYCCQLSTRVLFRTKLTQTIIFHLLVKWLLGSNLSQLYKFLLLFSQSKPPSETGFEPVQGNYFDIFKWWYGVFFDHLLFVRQIISFYSWTENFVSLKDVLIEKSN